MARIKKLTANPHASSRATSRRQSSNEPPPETVTGDLNEPPPISGENPAPTVAADEGSSKHASSDVNTSSKTLITAPALLDTDDIQPDEEERRLEEEYLQKKEAIRKRKEEAEKRRKEYEERIRKEEEDRRIEEAKQKAEREKVLEGERRKEEAEAFETDLALQKIVEESYQGQYMAHKFTAEKDVEPDVTQERESSARKRRIVTRSTTTTTRKTPTKKQRKTGSQRGKSSAPSVDSTSMNIDEEEEQVQTQNPHMTTVGTAHAPGGVPRQFTSQIVANHYESIKAQKLKLERGFDPDFVEANPFVKDRILAQDWTMLAAISRRANASLVREFYAEASQKKNPTVLVRGKPVSYNPETINRVLGQDPAGICEFTRFLKNMTPASEALILKTIAVEGKPWNQDGQRRCLNANSLTTEAAVWFLFLRASISPTSHDTTLSMHKCALLYCILTHKRINVGMVMHAAIDQARTRKKVNLPLPCLITSLMIDAGVPTAVEDQWFNTTSPINVQTIRRMGRHVTTPPPEPDEEIPTVGTVKPTVFIAEEHDVRTPGPSTQRTTGGTVNEVLTEILHTLQQLTYRIELLEAGTKYQNRALNAFWMYTRERDEVVGQFLQSVNPELATQLPTFPEDICATLASEDEFEGNSATDSPSATPSL